MKSWILCGVVIILALQIGSAQDKWNMTQLSNWDVDTLPSTNSNTYNDCWGYVDCNGNEYALMGSASFIHFIDVSDPTTPQEVDAYAGGGNTIWRDIKTWKQHAYSVCDWCSEGLQVFDLSMLPDTVIKTNQTNAFFGSCHNIFIDQSSGWLYAVGTNTQGNGVFVFDLNDDPDNPNLLAQVSLPGGYIHDLFVRDNIAYCSHGGSGLYVYDFSVPTSPVLLGTLTTYPESGYNHSCWLSDDDDHLVFADETHNRGLKLANVSDLTDIYVTDVFRSALLGPADTASIAHNPFIRENYIFVSYYHDGVQVFDFSDPDNVARVAYFDTHPGNNNYNGYDGCWGVYPFLPSGNILASDQENGLFVLSLDSIELTPTEVPLNPNPELTFASGSADLCEGETALLTTTQEVQNYQWYQDTQKVSNNPGIFIEEAGDYWAELSNEYCVQYSDTVQVTISPLPEIMLSADELSACEGDTVLLTAQGQADSLFWYHDDDLQPSNNHQNNLEALASGTYFLQAQLGICSGYSDTINLNFQPLPQLSLEAMPDFACEGDTVVLTALTNADSILWYENDLPLIEATNASSLLVTEAGTFLAEATLDICSVSSDEVSVSFEAVPTPQISLNMEDRILSVNQVGIIYQWFLNGEPIPNATESTFAFSENGLYTVEVVFENGCIGTSEPIEVFINSTHYLAGTSLKVFPNPTRNQVFIKNPNRTSHEIHLSLWSSAGKRLLEEVRMEASPTLSLDLPALPPGIYMLQLRCGEEVYTERLTIF